MSTARSDVNSLISDVMSNNVVIRAYRDQVSWLSASGVWITLIDYTSYTRFAQRLTELMQGQNLRGDVRCHGQPAQSWTFGGPSSEAQDARAPNELHSSAFAVAIHGAYLLCPQISRAPALLKGALPRRTLTWCSLCHCQEMAG